VAKAFRILWLKDKKVLDPNFKRLGLKKESDCGTIWMKSIIGIPQALHFSHETIKNWILGLIKYA
jgi:hypothetical protein